MLPGKVYKPEDLLKIVRKRFWLIVVPWALVAAATAGVAGKLPDRYRSSATIQVVPPEVPDTIVRSLSEVSFQDRLQATQQTILSRTRLERLIQDFDLYKEERQSRLMEEVVERMRSDIRVNPTKGETFTVEYYGRDPVTVMKVTAKLAGYFKDESAKEGTRKAQGTSSFLEAEVAEAERKLLEIEGRVKNYQLAHRGELPDQLGANMQGASSTQMNLNAVQQALVADANNKARLERDIEAVEAQAATIAAMPLAAGSPAGSGTTAQRLAAAQAQLVDYVDVRKYQEAHPDVIAVRKQIAALTKQVQDEANAVAVGAAAAASPTELARQKTLISLRAELDNINARIANNQQTEKDLRAKLADYQAKIDQAPLRKAEMLDLDREYDTLKARFNSLVAQREAANMSVNLERRMIGERFDLIDEARLPERPYSPNRQLIYLLGTLGGLGIGLGIVALLEYRDGSFKTDDELSGLLGLPVLAVVPLMRSDAERRSHFRKRLFMNLGLSGAVAACMAVVAYSFLFVR